MNVEFDPHPQNPDIPWPVIDDLDVSPQQVVDMIRYGLDFTPDDDYLCTVGFDGVFAAVTFNKMSERAIDTFTIQLQDESFRMVATKLGISLMMEKDVHRGVHSLYDLSEEESLGVASFVADVCSQDSTHPEYKYYRPLVARLREVTDFLDPVQTVSDQEIEFRQDWLRKIPVLKSDLNEVFGPFYI
jgi:hypothetical protein